jgi:hypothetical protein
MVFRLQRNLPRLASVLVSVAAVAAVAAAVAAVAAAAAAAAALALAAAALAFVASAVAAALYRHLRPLHRRSDCPKLHSLAQLSVVVRNEWRVLHHADCARHWKAPDSDLL